MNDIPDKICPFRYCKKIDGKLRYGCYFIDRIDDDSEDTNFKEYRKKCGVNFSINNRDEG